MKIGIKLLFIFTLYVVTLPSYADILKAKWSNVGRLSGEYSHCVAIFEPAEPKEMTWDDNFLCFNNSNHGFSYSFDGKIAGMNCISMDIKGGIWGDNYLCANKRNFNFFQRKLPKGYRCIRITEPSDPNPRAKGTQGNSNHFCLKK